MMCIFFRTVRSYIWTRTALWHNSGLHPFPVIYSSTLVQSHPSSWPLLSVTLLLSYSRTSSSQPSCYLRLFYPFPLSLNFLLAHNLFFFFVSFPSFKSVTFSSCSLLTKSLLYLWKASLLQVSLRLSEWFSFSLWTIEHTHPHTLPNPLTLYFCLHVSIYFTEIYWVLAMCQAFL